MLNWREYESGDISSINCLEPDPFEGWTDLAEEHGRAMFTFTLLGAPILSGGLLTTGKGEAMAFAVADRDKCSGYGPVIAKMIRLRIEQALNVLDIDTIYANADPDDRAAVVFLRAIGLRKAISGADYVRYERGLSCDQKT